MINVNNLCKTYSDGTVALSDVTLNICSSEMVLLKGHSGAGKTTLFKILLGIEAPSDGTVEIGGKQLDYVSQKSIRVLRRKIGVVFQDFRLIEGRTARENVELALRVLGLSGRQMKDRADEYIQRVELSDRSTVPVELLSQGEKQRVAVARALVRKSEIILADEPTGNLDEKLSNKVLCLLERERQLGATIVVAIHSPEILRNSEKRIVELKNGRVLRDSAAVKEVNNQ